MSRHRWVTTAIVTLTAFLMVIGAGQRVLDSYDSLADPDRMTAVSLVMSGPPRDALPVTLLDIDDSTRKLWQVDGATPHAALAELVRLAQEKGAAAILVDFDLSADRPNALPDPAMAALLASYPGTAPYLMLVRRIQFARTTGSGVTTDSAATPYDGLAANRPNIGWITTLNDIGRDRSVRKIRLWQTVCNGAEGETYASAALLLAARLFDGGKRVPDLETFLAHQTASECGHKQVPQTTWPGNASQAAQLPYVFSDRVGASSLMRTVIGGKATAVFRRISASQLVTFNDGKAELAGEVDRDPFAGRVVVAGATYADSGDIYETPVGTMPGSIILANSIVQAKAIADTAPARPIVKNLLVMALFLLFAAIARYFIGAIAIFVIGIVSLAALFALSRGLGFATAVDVLAVALPGFAFFKMIDSLVYVALEIPRRGWRAVLKP